MHICPVCRTRFDEAYDGVKDVIWFCSETCKILFKERQNAMSDLQREDPTGRSGTCRTHTNRPIP